MLGRAFETVHIGVLLLQCSHLLAWKSWFGTRKHAVDFLHESGWHLSIEVF